MKSLRHLVRRYTKLASAPARPPQSRQLSSRQRRLTSEALERRELLAAGIVNQNSWNAYDVNNDYSVTARDALSVINFLGRAGEGQEGSDSSSGMFYDVNGDNVVTAADALGVINAIGRGEGEENDQIEWLVTPRQTGVDPGGFPDDFNLDLIQADANGEYNVEVGQYFDIEFSYDDLRTGGARLGMFQAIADIAISQPDVLTLFMHETQQIFIGSLIDKYSSGQLFQGTITVSIPELPPNATAGAQLSASMSLGDFSKSGNFFLGQLISQLGFAPESFTVEQPQGAASDGQSFQIRFSGADFGNVDLPNISITLSGTPSGTIEDDNDPPNDIPAPAFSTIPITANYIPPQIDQGGQLVFNSDAVAFNIDTRSRTFDGNDNFYDSNVNGSFDPAFGFRALTGIGGIPIQGGGVPQLSDDGIYFPGPFDFLSFTVCINQAVTGLEIGVIPSDSTNEFALLYGLDDPIGSDPATTGTVIVEDLDDPDVFGNGRSVMIINAIDPNAPDPPIAGDTAMVFNEGSSGSVNLSEFLSGGTPDTVTASSANLPGTVNVGAGPDFAVTYEPADPDENTNGTITYNATNDDGSDSGIISVTINPINDAPVAVDDDGPFQLVNGTPITLTDAQLTGNDDPGAADETGDPLTAIPVGATSANGGTISAVAGGIQYSAPGGGFTGTDTFTYRVNDGSLDSANTATVTVNVNAEPVDPPTAADDSIPAFDEGSMGSIDLVSLLGGGAVDTLTVTPQGSRGSANIAGTLLTYTPNDDEFGSDTIVYTATNSGGSDTGTISVTINPINDAPVADDESLSTPENTPLTISFATLLNGDSVGPANEIPLDTLSIQLVNDPMNPLASLDQNGQLTYNPPPDFFGNDSFTYVITDGSPNGPLTATGTVMITITEGPNNIPEVDGPLSESFSEDDAPKTITEADLLFGASDPDDDTIIVRNLTRTSGTAAGITIVGNTLSVTPGANGSLTDGASASAVYTYEVFDGLAAVDQMITITINGENDPPVTGPIDDITTFSDSDPVIIDVLAVADAGSGENEPLSIVSASLSNPAAGTVTFNGTISFTPAPGFEGDVTVNYAISDGDAEDTGSVEVSVVDFVPSVISGDVFIDRIENMHDVLDGADPFRDGDKDENEQGLGGIPINLSNGDMTWTAITNLDGHFDFEDVAPGSYTLTYDPIPDVIHGPVVPMSIVIGPAGGEAEEVDIPLLGLTPAATSAHDILARTYINSVVAVAALRAAGGGGQGGLFASLDSDGKANFVMAAEGFDEVKYADLRTIDDSDTDAALLTLLKEDGDVVSAVIPKENVSLGPDGEFLRLFGGTADFSFITHDEDVTGYEEFEAAIDEILGDIE